MFTSLDLTYIACSLLAWYTPKATTPSESSESFSFPLPQTSHQYLDSEYLESFDEVFVIGDVHGCFDELRMLLDKADVPGKNILTILAGDMVKKGPKNVEVLDFLLEADSVIAIRGNNEDKVLKEYLRMQNSDYEVDARDAWIKSLTPKHIEYLKELPYTISLPSLNAVVVHAGLLPGVKLDDNDPHAMVNMRNIKINFEEGTFQAIDGTCEGNAWASLWCGPQHIYFGHDSRRMLQIHRMATGLDTACVYGKNLTGIFISGQRKNEFLQTSALMEYRVQEPKPCKV